MKKSTGTSRKGSLEDALDAAITNAIPAGSADAMVTWKLTEITGIEGGLAGKNEVTVTIEYTT